MTASLAADAAATLLLFVAPSTGAILSGALIVLYTWAAMPLHSGGEPSDCRCFLNLLNTRSRLGLVVRNGLTLSLAGVVLVGRPVASWMGLAFAVGLVGAAFLLTKLADRPREARDQVLVEAAVPPTETGVMAFNEGLTTAGREGVGNDE
jgi:hypothetical protein